MSRPVNWRAAAAAATTQREELAARTRRRVLNALASAIAPLAIKSIAGIAGVSYDRARRALETLVVLGTVRASGPANNRRFALIVTGTGIAAGGPASVSSAAGACAGCSSTPAARPGSEAA